MKYFYQLADYCTPCFSSTCKVKNSILRSCALFLTDLHKGGSQGRKVEGEAGNCNEFKRARRQNILI